MTKTKRGFIFAAFIASCGATLIAIVAMATENWISGTLTPNISSIKGKGVVNYGLFYGTFYYEPFGSSSTDLPRSVITCVTSENSCAFSSKKTSEEREREINEILSREDCKQNTKIIKENSTKYLVDDEYFIPDVSIEVFEENKVMYNRTTSAKLIDISNQIYRKDNISQYNRFKRNMMNIYAYSENNPLNTTLKCDPTFLNMGLHIMTTMFLSIAILVGSVTSIISLRNVVGNPVNAWFNIWGLYIWNSTAAVIYCLALIQWGVEYDLYIKHNVGIVETLKGQFNNNVVELGYSYWILLVSIFLHALSCGLFYLRQYLIDKEPEIPDKPDGNTDGMIFVY